MLRLIVLFTAVVFVLASDSSGGEGSGSGSGEGKGKGKGPGGCPPEGMLDQLKQCAIDSCGIDSDTFDCGHACVMDNCEDGGHEAIKACVEDCVGDAAAAEEAHMCIKDNCKPAMEDMAPEDMAMA